MQAGQVQTVELIGLALGILNFIVVVFGFVFYSGRIQQQIVQLIEDHRQMRAEFSKHSEADDRLFRDINAGLNRLLGRQEAVDTSTLLQKLLDTRGAEHRVEHRGHE